MCHKIDPDFDKNVMGLGGINSAEDGLKPVVNARTVHLTFLPYDRHPEFKDSSMATLIVQILRHVSSEHGIILHEATAMEDHVHLLVSFDVRRHLENDIVKNLKGASARYFLKTIGSKSGKLWGRKKHFENITSEKYFDQALRYIRENPAKAGIASKGRVLSELTADFSPRAAGFILQRQAKGREKKFSPQLEEKRGEQGFIPQRGEEREENLRRSMKKQEVTPQHNTQTKQS